jgi:cell division inhibitor SepF
MSFVSKIKNWVSGYNEDEALDYYEDDMPDYNEPNPMPSSNASSGFQHRPESHAPSSSRRSNETSSFRPKVLEHPSASASNQVMVVEPKTFEEALDVIYQLKSRNTVLLNFQLLDSTQAQRVIDFLAGATLAMEGHHQRIGDFVFVYTPFNVPIAQSQASRESINVTDAFWNKPL